MKKSYCITGGCGYLGYHIGKELKLQGHNVRLFDKLKPLNAWKDFKQEDPLEGFTYIQGDIINLENLESAFKGVDCVIHTASFGLSNRDQLPIFSRKIEQINVGGTKNVIKACCSQNVRALVYTSTHNVVFASEEICNGDESLPYAPLHKFTDHYSLTKSIAEQFILISNGRLISDGNGHLHTCALRLAGLVGPKEQRHIMRCLNHYRSGTLIGRFWPTDTVGDYILIHNAVKGHILASNALMDKTKRDIVGGNPYFISDGKPINYGEYHVNIARELGYPNIKYRIPVFFVWLLVYLVEMMPTFIHECIEFTTILTRTELTKMVTTHYFSNAKATRELGYIPTRPNDLSEIVACLQDEGYEYKTSTSLSEYSFSFKFIVLISTLPFAFYIYCFFFYIYKNAN